MARPARRHFFYDHTAATDKTLKLYDGHVHDLLSDLDKKRARGSMQTRRARQWEDCKAVKAVRVHAFGGIEQLVYEDVAQPVPATGEVLVRVKAAGVGPWDAWVRSGNSAIPHELPLTPGADLAGVVESVGVGAPFRPGDEVYGVANDAFEGAYAEYAVAAATRLARKPMRLGFEEAASVPVVASTAWQMVFDHGTIKAGTRVLVHGAAGNVGAYAVQMAKQVANRVFATAFGGDVEYVRGLGADVVIDVQRTPFETVATDIDLVIDTVGGETQSRSFAVLKRGGVLVSSVSAPDQDIAAQHGVRGVFFIVNVTSEGLGRIGQMIDDGRITTSVGDVLPLSQARVAHEMLAGRPHQRGKIVLRPGGH
jgi:NADPH:quinone reductase-like Zn-dependent oxidoreductase